MILLTLIIDENINRRSLVTYVCDLAFYLGVVKHDVYHGFGQHAARLSPDDIILTLKLTYCVEIFYVFAISFIKFSVLFFSRRIFSNRQFEIVLWFITGVSAAWMIVIILSFVFQCTPISKA